MARNYAQLQTGIWRDTDFCALPVLAQRLYLLLISQPDISMCGVVPYIPSRWHRTGPDWSLSEIEKDLATLVKARFVLVDYDTAEVWVRTFVRHNVLGPKNTAGAKNAWAGVLSIPLRRAIRDADPSVLSDLPDDPPYDPAYDPSYGVSDGVWHGVSDTPSDGVSDGVSDGASIPHSAKVSDGPPERGEREIGNGEQGNTRQRVSRGTTDSAHARPQDLLHQSMTELAEDLDFPA
jgi:hypothetical protein